MCHTFPLVNSRKKGREKSTVVSEGWLLLLVLNYCGNVPPLARYIVHNIFWGTVSTISVLLNGEPFGTVQSFSDGTVEESTGVPYFFLAAADPVVKDTKSNPSTSLSLSEAQSDYCKAHNWDPELPRCARVTLTGKVNVLSVMRKK